MKKYTPATSADDPDHVGLPPVRAVDGDGRGEQDHAERDQRQQPLGMAEPHDAVDEGRADEVGDDRADLDDDVVAHPEEHGVPEEQHVREERRVVPDLVLEGAQPAVVAQDVEPLLVGVDVRVATVEQRVPQPEGEHGEHGQPGEDRQADIVDALADRHGRQV